LLFIDYELIIDFSILSKNFVSPYISIFSHKADEEYKNKSLLALNRKKTP